MAEAIVESPTRSYPKFGEFEFRRFEIDDHPVDLANPFASDAIDDNGEFETLTGLLDGIPGPERFTILNLKR